MPSRIYTKTGDKGETSLCNGSRESKDSKRVEAYGTVDEINSFIGLVIVKLDHRHKDIKEHLIQVQNDLLAIGANLAYPEDLNQSSLEGKNIAKKIPRITEEMIKRLEEWINSYDEELPELNSFILSGGGTQPSALLHVCRTINRRAERKVVSLKKDEEVTDNVLKYLNRLSDYLFMAGRLASQRQGQGDLKWTPKLDKYIEGKK